LARWCPGKRGGSLSLSRTRNSLGIEVRVGQLIMSWRHTLSQEIRTGRARQNTSISRRFLSLGKRSGMNVQWDCSHLCCSQASTAPTGTVLSCISSLLQP
jgi:hypothetical protein